jgi:hypothetical protein
MNNTAEWRIHNGIRVFCSDYQNKNQIMNLNKNA